MNDPALYTAAQASDPGTPGQVLADVAALRPDLRPVVATNPSAYPGLLSWLGELGEPAVDSALRARHAGDEVRTLVPSSGVTSAVGGLPARPDPGKSPPWRAPDAGSPYQPLVGPPATSHAPAVTYPPFGVDAPFDGGPGSSYGVPHARTAPVGPGVPYGYGPVAAGGRGSGRGGAVWVVLAVLAGLVLLGVTGFLLLRSALSSLGPDTYGSDLHLDSLHDRCAAEDWQACDDLYYESPTGSEYEDFGETCGGRTAGGGFCVEEFATGTGTSDYGSDPDLSAAAAQGYGDDPALDVLWDACAGGDDQACDDLYSASPLASAYEHFGDTCGGRRAGGEWCVP